jgi:hypothetical protein
MGYRIFMIVNVPTVGAQAFLITHKITDKENLWYLQLLPTNEELDGAAVSTLGVRSENLSNVRKGQSSDG